MSLNELQQQEPDHFEKEEDKAQKAAKELRLRADINKKAEWNCQHRK